ncbi:ATP-binding protein [Dyadobacter pollutisoli]|jgi:anti-sigma regulatory factor (Ser/Thr protein kinase)|uniref:ATP-binding protein n=1 Tax=Dyadobacter pollutisoli TaxID=2910158 RepID=A0A9E8NEQ8_9BACT|nr:ATP-binding protein [Dyadobacter pollutisoli]WAC13627.1 ATP-binding protein [Dyadobacter pollutisoli]
MKEDSDEINIVFRCHREAIPGTLNVCLDQIRKNTESHLIDESVLSRIKWVITELLTNAVKHSGQDESALKIKISRSELVLEKADSGKPLILTGQNNGKISWPLENLSPPIDFPIYHNGMDSLCVRTDQNGKAVFFIEKMAGMEMPGLLTDTSEHFGLLIMTKASDEFTYEYDPLNKVNRFACLFNLNSK